jgi:hypothetical protein
MFWGCCMTLYYRLKLQINSSKVLNATLQSTATTQHVPLSPVIYWEGAAVRVRRCTPQRHLKWQHVIGAGGVAPHIQGLHLHSADKWQARKSLSREHTQNIILCSMHDVFVPATPMHLLWV